MNPPHESQRNRIEGEAFAEFVAEYEGRKERGPQLNGRTVWFSAGLVATIIGGVWGIAIAFGSFRAQQEANAAELRHLRRTLAQMQNDSMQLKEMDLWAWGFRTQNKGIEVPMPSDYKVKRPEAE